MALVSTPQVGQFGVPFYYTTNGLDMSAGPGYKLIFTKPDDSKLTKDENTTNAVSSPAVALTASSPVGVQAASTYMEFTTVVGDFDVAGTWSVCAFYADATRGLPGSVVEFEVLEACD